MEQTLEAPQVDPRLAVRDLSDREFRAWLHHPVTLVVLRFLRERSDQQWLVLREGFKAGSVTLADEGVFRGRFLENEEFRALQWSNIQEFYGLEETEQTADGATIFDPRAADRVPDVGW